MEWFPSQIPARSPFETSSGVVALGKVLRKPGTRKAPSLGNQFGNSCVRTALYGLLTMPLSHSGLCEESKVVL